MTKEIRSPNVEGRSGVPWPVRHSDFGIPLDFVIRHSSFVFENRGLWKVLFRFCARIGTMNRRKTSNIDRRAPKGSRSILRCSMVDVRVHGKNLVIGNAGLDGLFIVIPSSEVSLCESAQNCQQRGRKSKAQIEVNRAE